ncbi:ATP-binding cassette domain-containing protein [Mycolicibacterium sp. CBMA 226]|uniref:ATP-binding cassette domain-containing protein n=1 Tax=Mycolicibacterium sp. CBMA 226 TaxID=2606611 RepID=UPI00130A6C34|nr:ATP-binding cassette domain-containing protein [Mycolicibacterium sp. CBMA 226]MUL74779.1 ATP-binding cassette domain-containing protein [Mycolicibacterium sp. CBMA 226]
MSTVRFAIDLLRPRLLRLVLAVVLGTAALGSALALAGVSAWLITRAWQRPPILELTVAVVAVRLFGISRGVLGYCERLASHDVALRAAGRARTELYRRLCAAPPATVLRLSSGELVSRAGASVDDLADTLVRAVLPIAVATVLSTVTVIVIAVISPVAALALAAGLAVAGAWAPWQAARAAAATEHLAAAHHSDRDGAVMLALDHAAELAVAGRLTDVIAQATEDHRRWGDAADRAARPAALAAAVPILATGASAIAAVLAAISLTSAVEPTTLAILMLLPLSAFEATGALPAAAVQLTRARIAIARLTGMLSADPDDRVPAAVTPLRVAAGDRVAVLGASGRGKTTLLLSTADHFRETGSPAGFFAEDAHVFDTTLRDNLLVARGDATDEELTAVLEQAGLGPWLATLPDGLSTLLAGGAAAVSAGQRRRLLLARALLTDFPVILLDEPTEHLDAADSHRLLTELLTPGALFGADRAVVVATHHLPANLDCTVLDLSKDGYPAQS